MLSHFLRTRTIYVRSILKLFIHDTGNNNKLWIKLKTWEMAPARFESLRQSDYCSLKLRTNSYAPLKNYIFCRFKMHGPVYWILDLHRLMNKFFSNWLWLHVVPDVIVDCSSTLILVVFVTDWLRGSLNIVLDILRSSRWNIHDWLSTLMWPEEGRGSSGLEGKETS